MNETKVSTWGGKRTGAGRKKSNDTVKTVVIRVDASLVPIVKTLKEQYKQDKTLDDLIPVIHNQDDLEKLQARNMELVSQRDKEHLKVVSSNSKINSLQADYRALKRDYEALKARQCSCQALTKNGVRCTKPAKAKVKREGVELAVCLQHQKSLT